MSKSIMQKDLSRCFLCDSLKRLGQIAFEARHSHEEFMEIFKKNYL